MNPGSKGGSSEKNFKKIFQKLDKSKIEYDYVITKSLNDAYDYSVEANKKGYDSIVAIGGDGTINKCLNGFYNSLGERISKAKFGVIYTGTSPDFCMSYNIPIEIDLAIDRIIEGKCIKIDIGKINYLKNFNKNYSSKPLNDNEYDENVRVRFFGCCVNIGIGASVARVANAGIRKLLGDFLGTFCSMILSLIKYKSDNYTLKIFDEFNDNKNNEKNKVIKVEKVTNISIGKTKFIASGIKVKNNLKHNDKKLYILIIKNLKITNFINIIKRIYSGLEIKNDNLISLEYTKKVDIYGSVKNCEIEFDGDPMGFLPCSIEISKDQIDLIC
jgi:YegS/Rv2252/BmrU family lipid kinase